MMFKTLKRLRQFLLMTFMLMAVLACAGARSNILPQPLTSSLQARPGDRTVQEDWLISLPDHDNRFSSLEWLDATHLVYSISPKENLRASEIEVLDLNSHSRIRLGKGSAPKPSPDGKKIAFLQNKGEKIELWVMQANGTHKKRLVEFKEAVAPGWTMDFTWSPDSNSLAVNHQPLVNYWERDVKVSEDSSKTSAVDADHLSAPPPLSRIDIINVNTSELRRVASIDAAVRDLSWFPSGRELLFVAARNGYEYPDKIFSVSIQRMAITDGQVRTITTIDGLQQFLQPSVAPNGRKVAFKTDVDNPDFSYLLSLNIADVTDIAKPFVLRLTRELKLYFRNAPLWSLDGERIYVVRDFGAYRQIYAIETTTGATKQITDAPMSVKSFALSPDGSRLAWVAEDAHANVVVRIADGGGNNPATVISETEVPSDFALSEVKEIEWEVPDYPVRMRGLLVLPINYTKGAKYPLIVDIHGGGPGASIGLEGGILVSTPLEWQFWAAKGYAVFVPEFRSSGSFGSLAITRDEKQDHDLINRDVHDIVAGVDALISDGIVDSNRTAVIGHSAGGRRANWLTVATHQFRAVVSKEGWADEWLEFGVRGLERDYKNFGGSPSQKPGNYQKNSPIFHSIGASTPTLFLMGNPKLGGVDPYDTVRWLYNAIKEQGVATQYIRYPDEGHNFDRPANRKDALERAAKWIERNFGQ